MNDRSVTGDCRSKGARCSSNASRNNHRRSLSHCLNVIGRGNGKREPYFFLLFLQFLLLLSTIAACQSWMNDRSVTVIAVERCSLFVQARLESAGDESPILSL